MGAEDPGRRRMGASAWPDAAPIRWFTHRILQQLVLGSIRVPTWHRHLLRPAGSWSGEWRGTWTEDSDLGRGQSCGSMSTAGRPAPRVFTQQRSERCAVPHLKRVQEDSVTWHTGIYPHALAAFPAGPSAQVTTGVEEGGAGLSAFLSPGAAPGH